MQVMTLPVKQKDCQMVLKTEHCDRFLQAIIYRLLDGLWVT